MFWLLGHTGRKFRAEECWPFFAQDMQAAFLASILFIHSFMNTTSLSKKDPEAI